MKGWITTRKKAPIDAPRRVRTAPARPVADAQLAVLRTISEFIEREEYSPSFREIADARGVSLKGGLDHCRALRTKLLISWKDGKARTIRITAKGKRILSGMEDAR